jgi:zinc/manganese transport system permease protein
MSEIDWSILLPALATGLLVLVTHVPLGQRVLERGIIFIDLAVAQIAGLGVIIAQMFEVETHGFMVQVIATGSALLGALGLYFVERRWPAVQEALIGLTFVLAASAVMLLVAHHPHGAHQIDELFNGQILWVNFAQLAPVGILYAFVILLWFVPLWHSQRLKFYVLFALSVTASVQLVGVYLVFASLIVPALAVRRMKKHALWMGYLIGATGYLAGLVGSALFDLPSGPLIVWCLFMCAVLFLLVQRNDGLAHIGD